MINKLINVIVNLPEIVANGIPKMFEGIIAIFIFSISWCQNNWKKIAYVLACGIITLFTDRISFGFGIMFGTITCFLNWLFHSGSYT